jgi:lipopolysaccharide/colanic/teichoic acid biosynthesis glycosyltransferase
MENIRHKYLPLWKRALDYACILLALPAVLPLMVLIALAIRLCSKGPVLFRQERIGLLGRPFICFKFRSMKLEAETQSHQAHLEKLINSTAPMTKLDGADPRIIRIGHLLRASGMDELPQLLNVMKGEMSLVGPRPCIRYEYERFRPRDRERFNAVPGLTGLWQVSGKNSTTFQQMIDLDIQYTRTVSFFGDVKILFNTFPMIFGQALKVVKKKGPGNKRKDGPDKPSREILQLHSDAHGQKHNTVGSSI